MAKAFKKVVIARFIYEAHTFSSIISKNEVAYMFKKGQEISLNVIIVAAIVLIVMVVLITIFLGKAGQTGEELSSCPNKGGTCLEGSKCPDGQVRIPENCPANSLNEAQVCCRQLTGA